MSAKVKNTSPFPGIQPYQESESPFFYAREREVEDVLSILQRYKVVTVSGENGAGKTSLINAGVIPKLKNKFSGQSGKDWVVCNLRPGISPIENLSHSLSDSGALYINGKSKTTDHKNYTRIIKEKKDLGLIEIFGNSEIYEKKNLLIVIDQLEDLFKYTEFFDSNKSLEDNVLFDLIYSTSKYKETAIYFIIVIQTDFVSKLNSYDRFTELLNYSQYTLPKLGTNSVKDIVEKTFHKKNVQLSDDLMENLGDALKANPSLLPNINLYFRSVYFTYAKEVNKEVLFLDTTDLKEVGNFTSHFENAIESFFNDLTDPEKKCFELIMRSVSSGDRIDGEISYQSIDYIYEYNANDQNIISLLIKRIRVTFGHSLDVFKSIINGSDPNQQNNYNKSDIITLKYHAIFSWERYKSWQDDEKQNYTVFKLNNDKSRKYPKESLLTANSLEIAEKWRHNELINESWSKKYALDFYKTIHYIKESKKVHNVEQKKQESIKKDIKVAKKRAIKFQWSVIVIVFICMVIIGYERHIEAEKQEMFALEMTAKEAIAVEEKIKIELLNKDIISLRVKDSLSNIERDEVQLLRLNMIKKQLLSQQKMISLKSLIDEQGEKLESKRIRIIKDSIRAEEILAIAEVQAENASNSQDFIELKESISNVLYTLNNTTLNEYDRTLLGKVAASSIEIYESIKKLGVKLNLDYDGDALRQISVNLLAKLNGKKQYAEIEQFDLLKENNLPLRALNISKGGRITTGGESKTLFTSLNSIDKGIIGLQKNVTFKSTINALEFINENIVAVGLEDSSLWLIKLDTNEKTKIFKSKGWKPGKVLKTITNTFVKGINFVEYSNKNKTLIASLEKELIVIDFDKINDGKKAFTNKFELNNLETDEIIVSMSYSETSNTFFLATSIGNVILFDLETEKLLKFNNKLLNIVNETAVEIELYNDTVFIGTKEGSVYVYEYNKNKKLRYLRSKRANFSQVRDILFDNNTLYTLTKNGDLTILSYSENTAGEKKMKTPVSINFGEKVFGNAIESFTYKGVQYFVTADSSGNLVYWDLDLENTFNRIKQLYSEKYSTL